jgi:TPR repeat protein
VDAQLKLAEYYLDTEREDNDIETAVKHYQQASNSGNLKVKYELAILYLDGRVVEQDFIQAYYLFKECQKLNYLPAKSLFHTPAGGLKMNRIDYGKLITMLNLATTSNIDSLEYNLGCHYQSTQIFEYNNEVMACLVNTDLAKKWFKVAAEKGVASAQYELGVLYEADKEREDHIQDTIYWYSKAWKNGHLNAAFRLACLYLEGKVVVQDLTKSFNLLYGISSLGHEEATIVLNIFNTSRSGDKYHTIMKMLEEAAESGNTIAVPVRDLQVG